jgi:hypothetical protein
MLQESDVRCDVEEKLCDHSNWIRIEYPCWICNRMCGRSDQNTIRRDISRVLNLTSHHGG